MVSYLPYYSKEERHRHDVRPGLTGLAQINGRNTLTWEQRFDYELKYIREISLLNDVKIFFKTFAVALKREGLISLRRKTSMFTGKSRGRGDWL